MSGSVRFLARLVISLSFVVVIVLGLPAPHATIVALAWGLLLLACFSYILAQARNAGPWLVEVVKHLAIAVLVIAASRGIAAGIPQYIR